MDDPIVDRAQMFIRAHTTGDLRFDEHLRPLRYIVAPDGRLVAPVMVAMLAEVDTVLFVPALQEDAMELLVSLEQFEERGEDGHLTDRWRIYHGEPEDVRWARIDVDAVRHEGQVIDGEALMLANPLASEETGLCRTLNAEWTERIRELCRARHIEVEKPVVVGVDPRGLDIRRRFDVVRLESPAPMTAADDVYATLESMAVGAVREP
jgi:hypothetical protein